MSKFTIDKLKSWSKKHAYLLEYLGGYNVVLKTLTSDVNSPVKYGPCITKYGAIDFTLPKDKAPHNVGADLRLARYSITFKCHNGILKFTAVRNEKWIY